MGLKVNILLLLTVLFCSPFTRASDKFLRVRGELLDAETNESISEFTIRLIEDEMDSTDFEFEDHKYEIWVQANRESKLYFIKEGYVTQYIWIDATFIRSWAHDKKQSITNLKISMNKGHGRMTTPSHVATYDPKDNQFVVKDSELITEEENAQKVIPPFPSPADTFFDVKPTNNRLPLTKTFDVKKAKGNEGRSKIIQGILFADLNYCLFNEHTNEANEFLEHLKNADPKVWGRLKPFDSPEYGRIIMRTMNQEQSRDTLFALGMFVETSRIIVQDFTSDQAVLVHLKMVKKLLANYQLTKNQTELEWFVSLLGELVPLIDQLEQDYKDHLRHNKNFEMQADAAFLSVMGKIKILHDDILTY